MFLFLCTCYIQMGNLHSHQLHAMTLSYFLSSVRRVLTQADSLLHPGQKVFGIAAPQLGIVQCRLHSILTAKEGQVWVLGCEGVHQHHCRLCTLGAVSRDDIESTGLHPTVFFVLPNSISPQTQRSTCFLYGINPKHP